MRKYSLHRLLAIIVKEFVHIKRDKRTFALIVLIPLVEIILFGYAINSDPKYLPTVVVTSDYSSFTRSLIAGMRNSEYFYVTKTLTSEAEADQMLAKGEAQFVLNIPSNFTHDLVRGKRPAILLEADATDPAATGNAIAAMKVLVDTVFKSDLQGALNSLNSKPPPVDLRIHAKYNPAVITQYNILPGLMGVILTMTMVVITSVAMTREREHGTMESLLATPVQPVEVMVGKVLPYIIVGYIQAFILIAVAYLLFSVPIQGSVLLTFLLAMPFIAANLAVGLLFSTAAKTQLQAVQMAVFFFLPSILLSGFMFPFRGMPNWAQDLGEILPLTHFLRIVRGILLKGNGWLEVWPNVWPILLFLFVIVLLGVNRFRKTLD
jgi:ABC-2 type transport system permease protein